MASSTTPTVPTAVFVLTLPTAGDDLGRWMDALGVTLTITCVLGVYDATVAVKRNLRYNDRDGETAEHTTLRRSATTMGEAVAEAVVALQARLLPAPVRQMLLIVAGSETGMFVRVGKGIGRMEDGDVLLAQGLATVHRASIGEIDEHATFTITAKGRAFVASLGPVR